MQHKMMNTKLDNGMTVIVLQKEAYSQLSAVLTCEFGSCHQQALLTTGETFTIPLGTAHFIEHQLFRQRDGSDVSEQFSRLGARVNAFTTVYQTGYSVTTTTDLHDTLALLLSFVQQPFFTDQTVALEKEIILQELKLYEDDPFSSGYQRLMKQLYPRHAVGEDIVGTYDSIQNMSVQTLRESHALLYVPSRMTLVVVSPLSFDEVMGIVASQVEAEGIPECVASMVPQPLLPAKHEPVISYADVSQPILMLGIRLKEVDAIKDCDKVRCYLELLAELLLGPMSSFCETYVAKGWIDTSFHYSVQLEETLHCVVVECMSDEPERVREALQATLCDWQHCPDLTVDRLQRVIKGKIGDLIREYNDVESLANSVAQESVSYLEWESLIQRLTLEDIVAYGKTYWSDIMMSSVVIMPSSSNPYDGCQ